MDNDITKPLRNTKNKINHLIWPLYSQAVKEFHFISKGPSRTPNLKKENYKW